VTHHSVAAHLCGAWAITCPVAAWAVLAGHGPVIVIGAATVAAGALGWAVEWSQRAWGWGTYSWLDKAITAGGGAAGAVAGVAAVSL